MRYKDFMSLMPEVLAALKATGQNVSLVQDLEAAIEADRQRRGEPVKYCTHPICRGAGTTCTGVCSERFAAPQPQQIPEGYKPTKLNIGVSVTAEGAAICIMKPNADGTVTVIYSGTHPLGDSLGCAMLEAAPQPAEPVSAPKHLIERLQKHSEDKSNTAFARSTMREALQYLTAEPCVSSVSDKTTCGSASGDCDSQRAEPVTLECPKCGVDRAKAPCAGNLMDCEFKGVAHAAEPVKVPSDAQLKEFWRQLTEAGGDEVDFARALLARYDQP